MDDWVAVRSVGNDEAAARRLSDVLDSADPDPWRQWLRDALARKDWPAVDKLVHSADLERQPAATLSFLSAALRANGKFLIEEPVLRRAQCRYPADFWINLRLGVSLIWLQKPNHVLEGIGYSRVAVAVRPQSAPALMCLGLGYAFLGEHDQAIACYRKSIELDPKYGRAHSGLGLALWKQGKLDEAIASYRKAIELDPEDAHAHNNLAWLLATCPEAKFRDAKRAVELAKRAVELNRQEGDNWKTLGVAHYRAGSWKDAVAGLEKSMELGKGGAAYDWFFLAMAHWQLGKKAEARTRYDQAVEWMGKNQPKSEELLRFRAEAEELMKIEQKKD